VIDSIAEGSAGELTKGISIVMKLDIAKPRNYIAMGLRHHFVLALKKKG
jgi:hypothetical protein